MLYRPLSRLFADVVSGFQSPPLFSWASAFLVMAFFFFLIPSFPSAPFFLNWPWLPVVIAPNNPFVERECLVPFLFPPRFIRLPSYKRHDAILRPVKPHHYFPYGPFSGCPRSPNGDGKFTPPLPFPFCLLRLSFDQAFFSLMVC